MQYEDKSKKVRTEEDNRSNCATLIVKDEDHTLGNVLRL